MLVRIWRKGNSCVLLWECKLVQPLWKTEWRFHKQNKTKLKIQLAKIHLSTSGYFSEGN